jgi:hypothetical protein
MAPVPWVDIKDIDPGRRAGWNANETTWVA